MTVVQGNNKMKDVNPKVQSQPKAEMKVEKESKTEVKADAKPEVKETKKQDKVKRTEAVARGLDLSLSKKHCMYIGDFIKNKPIDLAISQLEEVIKFKRAIPMRGEIPHRSEPGMMSGRYPITASKAFITMLKGLKGNALSNGMDLDKTRIVTIVSNWASRPMRKGGARFKRTHVVITAKELEQKGDKK